MQRVIIYSTDNLLMSAQATAPSVPKAKPRQH